MDVQLSLQKESYMADYYQMLSKQNENQSILIHDMKNHLHSLALLNQNNSREKIDEYISKLLASSNLQGISHLCASDTLNAILCRYAELCKQKNIAFHTDIKSSSIGNLSDVDLTSLFCNLLDNSLEASQTINDAYIELSIDTRDVSSNTVITLINSCQQNPFLFGRKSLTTRKIDKERHGFGLKSINQTVERNHGTIQMYFNDSTMTFHTVITF